MSPPAPPLSSPLSNLPRCCSCELPLRGGGGGESTHAVRTWYTMSHRHFTISLAVSILPSRIDLRMWSSSRFRSGCISWVNCFRPSVSVTTSSLVMMMIGIGIGMGMEMGMGARNKRTHQLINRTTNNSLNIPIVEYGEVGGAILDHT